MLASAKAYAQLFSKLASDRITSRYPAATLRRAPHKPLLLLAVLDLFAEGRITRNLIELNPDLGEMFTLYWAKVMPLDQRGNIALPFFHLRSSGFWHLMPRPNMDAILVASKQIKSINQLQETIFGASLDEDLYALLRVRETREQLRAVLIGTYFMLDFQPLLAEQGIINGEAFSYSQELLQQAREIKETLVDAERYKPVARNQGFRRAVITAYHHHCAICGLRVLTVDGHTAADAAHIVPWSKTYDDRVVNGMALCQLCHWAFDEGMLGVSVKYSVVTSPQLEAEYNVPLHLLALRGNRLFLPSEPLFWPDIKALETHGRDIFRQR